MLFYVTFNSQGHIATGSLEVDETSAYCTVNHRALASNYQLFNMKHPARDLNQRPQRLEARTLTATPPSPLILARSGPLFLTDLTFKTQSVSGPGLRNTSTPSSSNNISPLLLTMAKLNCGGGLKKYIPTPQHSHNSSSCGQLTGTVTILRPVGN